MLVDRQAVSCLYISWLQLHYYRAGIKVQSIFTSQSQQEHIFQNVKTDSSVGAGASTDMKTCIPHHFHLGIGLIVCLNPMLNHISYYITRPKTYKSTSCSLYDTMFSVCTDCSLVNISLCFQQLCTVIVVCLFVCGGHSVLPNCCSLLCSPPPHIHPCHVMLSSPIRVVS